MSTSNATPARCFRASTAGSEDRSPTAPSPPEQVVRDGARTIFDFGEHQSEVASKKNPDGTTSFSTIAPGIVGLEFVVGAGETKTW
jgi:hypothetical protein